MYVNNPSYGLKLIDFIDNLNSDTIQNDLMDFVKSFLLPCKKYFYVDDDIIFNEFCEMFALNFYSRTFNFDTTLELSLKIQNLLLLNRKKYIQIYKASLYDLEPFNTYEHKIKDTESKNGESTTTTESSSNSSNTMTSQNEMSGKSETGSDNYVSEGYEKKTESKMLYGTTFTDNNKHLIANTPQSNLIVEDLFTNTKYVSNAENTNNSNTRTGTDTNTDTTTQKGHELNDTSNNYSETGSSGSNSSGNSSSDGKSENSFLDSREYQRIESGYNGNQIELLKIFSEIVFDVNKTIINDIEKNHLFSSYYL